MATFLPSGTGRSPSVPSRSGRSGPCAGMAPKAIAESRIQLRSFVFMVVPPFLFFAHNCQGNEGGGTDDGKWKCVCKKIFCNIVLHAASNNPKEGNN